jgi:hypothetical protein
MFLLFFLSVGCTAAPAHDSPYGGRSPSTESNVKDLVDELGSGVGLTHWSGNYGFSDQNYLIEGVQTALKLGTRRLFITLDGHFRRNYPGSEGPKEGRRRVWNQFAVFISNCSWNEIEGNLMRGRANSEVM